MRLRGNWPTLKPLAAKAATLAIFVALWQMAVMITRSELVPSPTSVATAFALSVANGQLISNGYVSCKRILVGFGVASLSGVVAGFAVARSRRVSRTLLPILELMRPVPPIAWIPLAIAFFGIGDTPSYFLIFIGAFYPVFTNSMLGVSGIAEKYLDVSNVLGVKGVKRFIEVIWPGALPSVFGGLRIGLGFAWMCLIAGEMVAVKTGLGAQMQTDRQLLKLDRVVSGMIAIGLIGYAMAWLLGRAEHYLLPWSQVMPALQSEQKAGLRSVIEGTFPPEPNSVGSNLVLDTLGFAFPGGADVLRNVSLRVGSGEVVAIMGHSGCGKTTLLRILAGLHAPTHGAFFIDGQNIRGCDERVAMVFQDDALFPWKTAKQNIMFGACRKDISRDARELLADQLLNLVGLQGRTDFYPQQLSGGQRQRVGIARALASRPRLLLMDEPFGSLDGLTRVVLQEDVSKLVASRNTTVLLVTHDVYEAAFMADRIVVVSEDSGTVQEITRIAEARPRPASFRQTNEFEQAARNIWSVLAARDVIQHFSRAV